MSQYLGIEIGGTKLQIGLGSDNGILTTLWRDTVDTAKGGEGIREILLQKVPELLEQAEQFNNPVSAIGVGFGGPVDDATGCAITSHQIQGWDHFPLTQWLSQHFSLPVTVGNDSDLAGLAEAIHGAGQGCSPLFYMNIGSGIGGALILHERIYRGVGKGAAEIGHLRIPTKEGSKTLEDLASGWAMGRYGSQRLPELADDQGRVSAMAVGEAAQNGNAIAQEILDEAWSHLANGICHALTLLCPQRIVLGGGVSLMGEILFEPLRALVDERVFAPYRGCYDIVPAGLGEEVVIHGAIALAKRGQSSLAPSPG